MTIVDTPGFADSEAREKQNERADELITVLKNQVIEANAILILIKGTQNNLDLAFVQTIRDLISTFGNSIWKNMVIGVSFWKYDVDNGQKDVFRQKWQKIFKEKFGIGNLILPFVFTDAHYQEHGRLSVENFQVGLYFSFGFWL